MREINFRGLNAKGEWVPEVGQRCQVYDCEEGWIKAEASFYDSRESIMVFKTEFGYSGYSVFRPLETEAEKERERLIALGSAVAYGSFNANFTEEKNCASIAEAFIDAGWRPSE